jgi:hypothetical protein
MATFDPASGPVLPATDVLPMVDRTGLGEYSVLVSYGTHDDCLIVDHAAKPSGN